MALLVTASDPRKAVAEGAVKQAFPGTVSSTLSISFPTSGYACGQLQQDRALLSGHRGDLTTRLYHAQTF